MLIILLFVFLALALLDVPGLVRKKYWWELAVYSGLMLTALILSVLLVMGVPMPAVTTEIGKLTETVFGLKSGK